MVNFRGARRDDIKGMDVMVKAYDSSKVTAKNGAEIRYLDVQALQIEGANPNLPRQDYHEAHFFSRADEKGGFNTNVAYGPKQFESIVAAAGDNAQPLLNKDGEKVGTVYALKGDLLRTNYKKVDENGKTVLNDKGKPVYDKERGTKSVILTNPEPMPADFKMPENIVNAQFEALRENHEAIVASREAQQNEPEAGVDKEAEAAVENEMDEPEL